MTAYLISGDAEQLRALSIRYLREPSNVTADEATGAVSFWFEPDLTGDELARFQRLDRIAASAVQITDEEWLRIAPDLLTLRTLRTRTDTDWSALTAAQRDRDLIDWCRSITDILRALLRD